MAGPPQCAGETGINETDRVPVLILWEFMILLGGGVSINNCRWGKVLERKTSGRWDRNGMGMRVPTPLVMTRVRHRGRGGRAAGNRAGRSSGTRGGVPESRGRDLGRVLWATVTRAEVLGNPREGQRHLTWVFS